MGRTCNLGEGEKKYTDQKNFGGNTSGNMVKIAQIWLTGREREREKGGQGT
jgi:hypothetical protein